MTDRRAGPAGSSETAGADKATGEWRDRQRQEAADPKDGQPAVHTCVVLGDGTSPVPGGGMPRIAWVVDDDPAVRQMMARHVARLGWVVRAFATADAALGWLGDAPVEERPHLVVSDIDMPGLTGEELALILRRDHPDLAVLLVSGRAPAGRSDLRLGGGTTRVAPVTRLGKPYDLHTFGLAVADALGAAGASHTDRGPSRRDAQ